MDKVFSTRLDESIIEELDRAVRRLKTTKKQFLKEAITLRVAAAANGRDDVWSETCGAWDRKETASVTVTRARRAFERSMHRHKRR